MTKLEIFEILMLAPGTVKVKNGNRDGNLCLGGKKLPPGENNLSKSTSRNFEKIM